MRGVRTQAAREDGEDGGAPRAQPRARLPLPRVPSARYVLKEETDSSQLQASRSTRRLSVCSCRLGFLLQSLVSQHFRTTCRSMVSDLQAGHEERFHASTNTRGRDQRRMLNYYSVLPMLKRALACTSTHSRTLLDSLFSGNSRSFAFKCQKSCVPVSRLLPERRHTTPEEAVTEQYGAEGRQGETKDSGASSRVSGAACAQSGPRHTVKLMHATFSTLTSAAGRWWSIMGPSMR